MTNIMYHDIMMLVTNITSELDGGTIVLKKIFFEEQLKIIITKWRGTTTPQSESCTAKKFKKMEVSSPSKTDIAIFLFVEAISDCETVP